MIFSSSSLFLYPLPAGTLPSLFAHVASSPFSKQDLPAQYPASRGGLQSLACAEGRSLLVLFLDLCSSTCLAPPEPHGSLSFILESKTLLLPLAVPFHPHLYLAPATWYKHRLSSDSLSGILNFLTDSMTAGLHAWHLLSAQKPLSPRRQASRDDCDRVSRLG